MRRGATEAIEMIESERVVVGGGALIGLELSRERAPVYDISLSRAETHAPMA